MKLVAGGSLADRMRDLARDPRAAVGLLEAVARGVHYAHQRGILHRDLKPANLLLDTRHETRDTGEDPSSLVSRVSCLVSDFGLAKRTGDDSSLTQSGAVMGTPAYMAPEQARGDKALTTAAGRVRARGDPVRDADRPPAVPRRVGPPRTLRMVEDQEPVTPRTINPACDGDCRRSR
jgi:serine/threonine-protein kinase